MSGGQIQWQTYKNAPSGLKQVFQPLELINDQLPQNLQTE